MDTQTAESNTSQPAESQASITAKAGRSGPKVTVCCKYPNGLLLRLFRMEEVSEPVMGGGSKTVQRAVPSGEAVKVNGPAVPYGKVPSTPIVGGYALTPNVDADFFHRWLEQNKDSEVVRNKLIFASEKSDTAQGMSEDLVDVKSNLEPLVPDTDLRIPRAANPNVGKVVTGEKAA